MAGDEGAGATGARGGDSGGGVPGATRAWVQDALPRGERVEAVVRLRGGWTSEIHRLDLVGPGGPRSLVLRSFVRPFFVRHAEGLLTREAAVLRLLGPTDVPGASVVAVDATARHCAHPSLLMTLLPGAVRLDDRGAGVRAELLARQLVQIHRLHVEPGRRPRAYQPWTAPDRVNPPEVTGRCGLWRRAVDAIRREPPDHRACFLHRDFHPGNVLFTGTASAAAPDPGTGAATAISGVVDWVETSWGPADLDVAHCATALALLHGVPEGMRFADRYAAAGGTLAQDRGAHLYWRLLDALAFAPDAGKVAEPWRELGRTDLTSGVLTRRLEGYIESLFDRYG
jgi:aminoglycoside phosphotransferase (APT) family kinase protein